MGGVWAQATRPGRCGCPRTQASTRTQASAAHQVCHRDVSDADALAHKPQPALVCARIIIVTTAAATAAPQAAISTALAVLLAAMALLCCCYAVCCLQVGDAAAAHAAAATCTRCCCCCRMCRCLTPRRALGTSGGCGAGCEAGGAVVGA
jgi:hypothetical protein